MKPIISINSLSKTFKSGFNALENISLDINKGEIFALLGPNGAGKTTLISIITGITIPTSGSVKVNNYDVIKDPIKTRSIIGLVPQEVAIEPFETVLSSIKFSRGLFGKPQDSFYINNILKQLSLWEKRNTKIIELSGGMKRRVLIAKALSHEPLVLFLDEPTAGVDVELRKDMWSIIRALKDSGVTIILTTHYIEEAENLADRVGFINNGQISLIEEKQQLINKMGKKTLSIHIQNAIQNALNNKTKNVWFFPGDLKDLFRTNIESSQIENPDVMIIDPPRAGLHPNTIIDIIKKSPKRMIYVSCNPATQVRDLKPICENNYKIINIQPIDMFPHTPHIENVVTLTLKD